MSDQVQTEDFVQAFQVGDTAVRGKIVRLGGAVDELLNRHSYPEPLSLLTGEALALVTMLGSALKFDGKLILQMQGDGPVSLIVADYTTDGNIRAMASYSAEKENTITKARGPELHYLLAKGHMVMTVDQGADMERYQGITALDGPRLAVSAVNYFRQSEQIPTAISLAAGRVTLPGGETQWRAGGIMVQHVPDEGGFGTSKERAPIEFDEDAWETAEAILNTTQPDELIDPMISAETLLYRLYHESGARVFETSPVQFGCGCSAEKVSRVLDRYTTDDLKDMAENGIIKVNCEFCRTEYTFPLK